MVSDPELIELVEMEIREKLVKYGFEEHSHYQSFRSRLEGDKEAQATSNLWTLLTLDSRTSPPTRQTLPYACRRCFLSKVAVPSSLVVLKPRRQSR